MKKLYFILLMVFTFPAVFAQPYVGDVIVKCHKIEQQNGMLHLELDVEIDDKAMNTRQSWSITPEISSKDRSMILELPYILVNGKNKRQMYERKMKFENEELMANLPYMVVNVDKDDDTAFRYIADVPFENWMSNSDLSVRQVLTSCRESKQLFLLTLEDYWARPDAVRRPRPQVSFILPDTEMTLGNATITYRLDRTDIDPNYADNQRELDKINTMTQQAENAIKNGGEKIYIDGYASPEGPYGHNADLSVQRAERLKNYVRERFGIPEDRFVISSVTEDWRGFRENVVNSNLPQKDRILAIIDSSDSYEVKERRIKELDGGVPYRTALKDILPDLRRAEYRIQYSLKDISEDEFSQMLSKSPEQLSQRELYLMALHYDQNSNEFRHIYDQMVKRYGDDPVANNNAAAFMLVNRDPTSAYNHLNRAGNSPEALNNLGIYYMLEGDYERAEDYFKRANQSNLREAQMNLNELSHMRDNRQDRFNNTNYRQDRRETFTGSMDGTNVRTTHTRTKHNRSKNR